MKLLPVKRTKRFTERQAINMAFNLKARFRKPTSIECNCCTFYNKLYPHYHFYIENTVNVMNIQNWSEVQDLYFEWINK